jgi:hypothetical protein
MQQMVVAGVGGGGCDVREGAIVYMLFLKFQIKYFSS